MAEPASLPIDLVALDAGFRDFVPFNRTLGLVFTLASYEPAVAVMRLDWNEHLVGHPVTQVIHGGAITALIDATSGASVFLRTRDGAAIATLDLRLDYLKPAKPQAPVFCRAECYKTTKHVAFVRAIAYQDNEEDLIASSAGTFMLGTSGVPVLETKR